jgi:sigma-E factor negative regulatory protein RseC
MKQEFEVLEVTESRMRLKPPKQGCGSCSLNSSCGTGILDKYFNKPLYVPLQIGAKVGSKINLEILDKTLFQHAFVLYILPLLALFLSAILSAIFYPNQEGLQIVLSLFFFAISLLLIIIFRR